MCYMSLWAKSDPYHPLWCHLLDSAAVCESLLPRFGGDIPLPYAWTSYLVGLHDIGKADPLFQNRDATLARTLRDHGLTLPDKVEPYRHEARSADWVRAHLIEDHGWDRYAAIVISQALRGHHADFKAGGNSEANDNPTRFQEWEKLRGDLANLMANILCIESAQYPIKEFDNASAIGVRLAGLVVLSDWIASNEELFPYAALNRYSKPGEYWSEARREAQAAVARLALNANVSEAVKATPRFTDVWPNIPNPYPSQRVLEEVCLRGVPPGLAIIEAPMGEGKTESAIYLAECWNRTSHRDGAYIALPTQATSNQMFARYAKYLKESRPDIVAPRLVHGMAWLYDDTSPTKTARVEAYDRGEEEILSRDWFCNAKRALIASHGVGTIDQALMATLNVRHGFLRLLGLSSKVLIIDEVHAYDEYMTVLMERLLNWCGALQIPVIMLSATLSRVQKSRLIEAYTGSPDPLSKADEKETYPLLTFAPFGSRPWLKSLGRGVERNKHICLRCHPGLINDPEATARLAVDETLNGGCACVIVNTVDDAQKVYCALQKLNPRDTESLLFHARFPAWRRMEIERQVVALFGKNAGREGNPPRPGRAILVATQVIEQSLDIDFDVMITQLAPVDLLLQRCGRLHRHDRGKRPTGSETVLHVLLPAPGTSGFGKTESIYFRELLLRTLALLNGRQIFDLPDDFRPLIEGCYGGSPIPGDYIPEGELRRAAEKRREDMDKARNQADTHLIPRPSPREFTIAEMAATAVWEGEPGDKASYFHARTRLGDEMRSVLALSDAELVNAARQEEIPNRETLRRLYLQKADVPRWWLENVTPEDGFDPCFEGPKWLGGQLVIRMQDCIWRGWKGGCAVTLTVDPILGFRIRRG